MACFNPNFKKGRQDFHDLCGLQVGGGVGIGVGPRKWRQHGVCVPTGGGHEPVRLLYDCELVHVLKGEFLLRIEDRTTVMKAGGDYQARPIPSTSRIFGVSTHTVRRSPVLSCQMCPGLAVPKSSTGPLTPFPYFAIVSASLLHLKHDFMSLGGIPLRVMVGLTYFRPSSAASPCSNACSPRNSLNRKCQRLPGFGRQGSRRIWFRLSQRLAGRSSTGSRRR